MVVYSFDVEVECCDFVKIVIRFESMGVWDFGLEKS